MYHPSMSATNPRKRPAPGATPVVPLPPQMQNGYTNVPGDQVMRWAGAADTGSLADATGLPGDPYALLPAQGQYAQGIATPSTALARRQMNRALVPTVPRANFDASADTWRGFIPDDPSLSPTDNAPEQDNVEELEELALKAMREAKSKRKQIPPFVQKLSSFLDENKNVDLIRWSDKGDSFVVLDEDEFARTLIPELFKHNNYASFVRQLNMYGFHKKVGLSDNSMRASERKNKSPSEYSNPYFRRGHPNLLWLINKPKTTGKSKKGKGADGDGDSDEDGVGEDTVIHGHSAVNAHATRALPAADGAPLQKREVALLREELAKVRDQQKQILNAIGRLQANNQQLYAHAQAFQNQHDRHQNSINAILNFLANVFRKTLEDQSGAQNLNDLLSSVLPNAQVPPGSVFDLGDILQPQPASPNPLSATKRARGLLMPIPEHGKASTVASPAATTPGAFTPGLNHAANPQMGYVTEVFDTPEATTPGNHLVQELETNPHESMMRIIRDTNANNSSGFDLPEVVNQTSARLSQDQRTKMLNMMAQSASPASASTAGPSTAGPSTASRLPSTSSAASSAMASSTQAPLSLSPIVGSAPLPPPMSQIKLNDAELESLRRLQDDQNNRIDQIQSLLGPLSPSGRIPGLDANGNPGDYYNDPPVDIDEFLNLSNDSNFDFTNGSLDDADEFDFSLIGPNQAAAGLDPQRVVEAGSSPHSVPSPAGTEEIPRGDVGLAPSLARGSKRRRMG